MLAPPNYKNHCRDRSGVPNQPRGQPAGHTGISDTAGGLHHVQEGTVVKMKETGGQKGVEHEALQRRSSDTAVPPALQGDHAIAPTASEVPVVREPQKAWYGGGRGRNRGGRAKKGLPRAVTASQCASVATPEATVTPTVSQAVAVRASSRGPDDSQASSPSSHPPKKLLTPPETSDARTVQEPLKQPLRPVGGSSALSLGRSNSTKRSSKLVDLSDDDGPAASRIPLKVTSKSNTGTRSNKRIKEDHVAALLRTATDLNAFRNTLDKPSHGKCGLLICLSQMWHLALDGVT